MVRCPYCGGEFTPPQQKGAGSWQQMPTWEHEYYRSAPAIPGVMGITAGPHVEAVKEAIFERPARKATRESDVQVPLQQAAVSGVVGFLAGGLAAVSGGLAFGAPWWFPVLAAPGTGLFMFVISWFELLDDSRDLLREVQRFVKDDALLPSPSPRLNSVRLEVQQDRPGRGPGGFWHDLPAGPDMFTVWAKAALAGQSIAVNAWTGSEGLFSRSEYESLLTFLTSAEVLRWSNPKSTSQGRELTKGGRAALRQYLESNHV